MRNRREPTPITPLPVPDTAREILLFGGSFDPVTRAHRDVALAARDRALAPGGWVVLVPAARSPHKDHAPGAPAEDRLRMLALAFQDDDRVGVWTDELDRAADAAPSFWIDTVERAQHDRPPARFRFLIGADQAVSFHAWREPRRILDVAQPLVAPRPPIIDAAALRAELERTGFWTEPELAAWQAAFLEFEPIDLDATRARRLLASAAPDEDLAHVLDPRVTDHARAHGLYTNDS